MSRYKASGLLYALRDWTSQFATLQHQVNSPNIQLIDMGCFYYQDILFLSSSATVADYVKFIVFGLISAARTLD